MWVYIYSGKDTFTVGFYCPDNVWHTDLDYGSRNDAAERVRYLNGGNNAT